MVGHRTFVILVLAFVLLMLPLFMLSSEPSTTGGPGRLRPPPPAKNGGASKASGTVATTTAEPTTEAPKGVDCTSQPHRCFAYWDPDDHEPAPAPDGPDGPKYVTFETWHGGWNNERMGVEIVYLLAHLWGRTLVMPPPYGLYLLEMSQLEDYFDFDGMHRGTHVISWAEFEKREGIKRDNIKEVATVLDWKIGDQNNVFVYPNNPTKESPEKERVDAFAGPRALHRDMSNIPDAKILHFPSRCLFAHFYTYLIATDLKMDIKLKVMARDHLRLRNGIFERAQRVVDNLPDSFATAHIRRGDFQYQDVRHLTADQIADNMATVWPEGGHMYVATDMKQSEWEKDKFDKALEPRWTIHRLGDYMHVLKDDTPRRWYPMIEQIICTAGAKFIGSKLSTFSAYIWRLRGYMQREDNNYYITSLSWPDGYKGQYSPDIEKDSFSFRAWYGALWGREYVEAYRDIPKHPVWRLPEHVDDPPMRKKD